MDNLINVWELFFENKNPTNKNEEEVNKVIEFELKHETKKGGKIIFERFVIEKNLQTKKILGLGLKVPKLVKVLYSFKIEKTKEAYKITFLKDNQVIHVVHKTYEDVVYCLFYVYTHANKPINLKAKANEYSNITVYDILEILDKEKIEVKPTKNIDKNPSSVENWRKNKKNVSILSDEEEQEYEDKMSSFKKTLKNIKTK